MAELDQEEQILEVDSIPTSKGIAYYDMGDGRSQISHPQPLTGHPPVVQNGLDGDCHLHSSIVRDGRLQSGDYRRRLDECSQIKQRASDELHRLHQMCEDLCMENERLQAENAQLRAEDGLCRNCKLSLSLPLTEDERTLREQALSRKLEDTETKNKQLQHRCKELLDEMTRLRNRSPTCSGAIDDVQYESNFEDRGDNLTDPQQTESVGNAFHDVEPLTEAVNERREEQRGATEQAERATEVERPRTPSPDECAIFLADYISSKEINKLLRNMDLSSVTISDLEERHPKDPIERRIDGIKTGIASAKGDRFAFLLGALTKSQMIHQANLLCKKFNMQGLQGGPIQENGSRSSQKPLQASSPDDFADSPCLEPQSDFETVLQPFLADPVQIHDIAVEIAKEKDFTESQRKQFFASFPGWKREHRTYLEKKVQSRCTMDVLHVWAQVEVERRLVSDPVQGIEFLAKALRASERLDVFEKLRCYLLKGVVGPFLKRDLYLRKFPNYTLQMEIIQYLGLEKEPGHDDWRALAKDIGHEAYIPIWEQKPNCGEVIWNVWKTSNDATVGKLYNWAVDKNRLDIAGVLERGF